MKVEDVSWGMIVGAIALVLVIVAAYNAIMTAVKHHREEVKRKRAPVEALETRADSTTAMLKAHEEMLKSDRQRLTALEEQQRIMLRALMAMLSHEVNGNSVDKLRASVAEIQEFLIRK